MSDCGRTNLHAFGYSDQATTFQTRQLHALPRDQQRPSPPSTVPSYNGCGYIATDATLSQETSGIVHSGTFICHSASTELENGSRVYKTWWRPPHVMQPTESKILMTSTYRHVPS